MSDKGAPQPTPELCATCGGLQSHLQHDRRSNVLEHHAFVPVAAPLPDATPELDEDGIHEGPSCMDDDDRAAFPNLAAPAASEPAPEPADEYERLVAQKAKLMANHAATNAELRSLLSAATAENAEWRLAAAKVSLTARADVSTPAAFVSSQVIAALAMFDRAKALESQLASLSARDAETRKDRERMDWLEASQLAVPMVHDRGGWRVKDRRYREHTGQTLREAIDAARSLLTVAPPREP